MPCDSVFLPPSLLSQIRVHPRRSAVRFCLSRSPDHPILNALPLPRDPTASQVIPEWRRFQRDHPLLRGLCVLCGKKILIFGRSSTILHLRANHAANKARNWPCSISHAERKADWPKFFATFQQYTCPCRKSVHNAGGAVALNGTGYCSRPI